MSSIWTPGGEHPVGRDRDRGGGAESRPGGQEGHRRPPGEETESPPADQEARRRPRSPADSATAPQEPTPEEQARLEEELGEVQRQLADTPARVVVANHAIGLFQLAALHLNQQPPNLEEGRLAIDAMAVLVEGLAGRLGDDEASLRDALAQLQLAFVQLRQRAGGGAE